MFYNLYKFNTISQSMCTFFKIFFASTHGIQLYRHSPCSIPCGTSCAFSVFFQIHWFSIFNSFMMVIFLVGLVSMILMRTLRKDYARYSKEDDLDEMVRSPVSSHLAFISSTFELVHDDRGYDELLFDL